MSQYIVEYRTGLIDTFKKIEADTLQIAQREVEGVIESGAADEAVIYQAMKVTRARRVVTSSEAGKAPASAGGN